MIRDAQRQPPHSRGRERGAAGAARGDHAADPALAFDPAAEGLGHAHDGLAPVAGKDRAGAAGMHRGDLHRRDVRPRDLARSGEIDRSHRYPEHHSRSRMKPNLAPLVSKVPTTSAVRPIRSANGIANTARASSASASPGLSAALTGGLRNPQRFGKRSARYTGAASSSAKRQARYPVDPRAFVCGVRARRGLGLQSASSPCRPTPSNRC